MPARVRVRFAPSPTGLLHLGGLRTALYNHLMAKKHGGDFLLRIEDTDQARTIEGGIEHLCRALQSLDIIPNEGVWLDEAGSVIERGDCGPYIQSKRKSRHTEYAMELLQMDKAYSCFCTEERLKELRASQQLARQPPMYDGACRSISRLDATRRMENGEPYVIRLKLPKTGTISVWDAIRDEIVFDWSVLDDAILLKSDGFPTYHLAAICDDHDMRITHVIRGEEWLPSTPKHLFLFDAFGWEPPIYAHLPLILNQDRTKLSKRQGDVTVEDYLTQGYLPEALVNFVALLGWNPTGDRELYDRRELEQRFDLAKMNKSGAIFNLQKLKWMNEHYLHALPEEEYLKRARAELARVREPPEFLDRCLLLVRSRVTFLREVAEFVSPYLAPSLDLRSVQLPWKTQTREATNEQLQDLRKILEELDATVFESPSALETRLKDLIRERGWETGETLWPLRVALSGAEKSPTPFELLWCYGKERSLRRLADAIAFLTD